MNWRGPYATPGGFCTDYQSYACISYTQSFPKSGIIVEFLLKEKINLYRTFDICIIVYFIMYMMWRSSACRGIGACWSLRRWPSGQFPAPWAPPGETCTSTATQVSTRKQRITAKQESTGEIKSVITAIKLVEEPARSRPFFLQMLMRCSFIT